MRRSGGSGCKVVRDEKYRDIRRMLTLGINHLPDAIRPPAVSAVSVADRRV